MKYLNLFESFDPYAAKKDDVNYIEQMLYDLDEYGYTFEVTDYSYDVVRVMICNEKAQSSESSDSVPVVEWDIVRDKICQILSILNNYKATDVLFRTLIKSSNLDPWWRLSDIISGINKAHHSLPSTPSRFEPIDISKIELDINYFLSTQYDLLFCIHEPGMNEWLVDFHYRGENYSNEYIFKSSSQFDDMTIEIPKSELKSDVLPMIDVFSFTLKKNI